MQQGQRGLQAGQLRLPLLGLPLALLGLPLALDQALLLPLGQSSQVLQICSQRGQLPELSAPLR